MLLGNDIVNINSDANISSFARERYLKLCFHPHELKLINSSAFLTPYILWSAKESAYKCSVKLGLKDRFNPIDFSGFICNENYNGDHHIRGYVLFKKQKLSFFSEITTQYIHTICSCNGTLENVDKFVIQIDLSDIPKAGLMLKQQLCEKIKSESNLAEKSFQIINNDKTCVPYLFINNKICQNFDISLSHDDNYAACCHSGINAANFQYE